MKPRVLVVDDSLTVRMDLTEAFHAADFEVTPCEDLGAARRALRTRSFELVVLDVLLPDGDGLAFLKEIKLLPSPAPVMLLSSEADVRDRIVGLKTGADEYVGKPYDSRYVVARARELMTKKVSAASRPPRTVLVIDDSATFRDLLRNTFAAAGYSVLLATTGDEGLGIAAASHPDAVVVDGMLPGVSGPTVIQRLKKDALLRGIPCLLLTGSSGDEKSDELQALEAGADAFVRKAADTGVILSHLTGLLRPGRTVPRFTPATLLGPKRLLAVDDDVVYLDGLSRFLTKEGYEVIVARSCVEALELLTVQPVDAILLDLVMPKLSGPDTCRKIKSSPAWREIPVIFLSAHEDRSSMLDGINAGADDYVTKSTDVEILKARLWAQIRRKTFEDENRRIRDELLGRERELIEAHAAHELAAIRAVQGEALRVKQDELDRFFQVTVDLLCVAGLDGVFKRVNPAWTRLFGFSEAALTSEPFLSFVHPDDRARTQAEFERITEGVSTKTFENRYRCLDGSYKWMLWSAVVDPERKIVFASARDMTERRRTEDLLRAQADELSAQQRELEAKNVEVERASRLKTEFLGNMSHELRTPLNAVIGFSELILDNARTRLEPTEVGYVGDILESGKHLLHLINDILDLVKIEAGKTTLKLEPLEPDEVICDAVGLILPVARKKHMRLEKGIHTRRCVLADRARLRQVLLNLLSNAIKFCPAGSTVTVVAEDQDEFIRFRVRDEGPGMEKALLEQLFRPFVQGESSLVKTHQGTGLGLAISKGLVEQHGGTIEVTSRLGAGSTFSFTILASELEVTSAPEATGGRAARVDLLRKPLERGTLLAQVLAVVKAERNPLILAIDDDVNVGTLLRSALEPAGYRFATEVTGHDGLARARSAHPDLIIADLMLPDLSGFDLVDALARDEGTRSIPVFVLTARELTETERARLKRHAHSVAEKGDLTPDDLLAAVRAATQAKGAVTATGPTILVVDDHDMNREVARAILERKGYRVIAACDGEAGIQMARADRPVLILMDLAMPRKDGFTAARELKADPSMREIPILALTALAMRSDEERARQAGFDGYLTKPIDRAALEEAVGEFVGGEAGP